MIRKMYRIVKQLIDDEQDAAAVVVHEDQRPEQLPAQPAGRAQQKTAVNDPTPVSVCDDDGDSDVEADQLPNVEAAADQHGGDHPHADGVEQLDVRVE